MKKNILFFIALLIILLVLFSFLYLIGFMNLLGLRFIPIFSWDNNNELGKIISIVYIIVVSIFLILSITFMIRIIMSLRYDSASLTSMNVDEITVKKNATENFTNTFDKLVESLNKNINTIQNYTEIIDTDLNKIDKAKIEASIQEKIDDIYQNFSHMVNDILLSSTVSELFDKIINWGVDITASKRGSIMVVDKNKELYIYKTIGWDENEAMDIKDIKIPLGSGIAGKVASENKRIFVTNIENYHEFDFKYKDKYNTKSFISMPIMGINKVVAVLNLTESSKSIYSMNDLEILNIITKLSSKIFELIQVKKKISKQGEEYC